MTKNVAFAFFICLPWFSSSQTTLDEGEQLFQQKKYTEAAARFTTYLVEHPENLTAREYLGDIACFQENWDKAVSAYKILVQRSPENANYNFKYGGALGLKAIHINKMKAIFYIPDIKKYLKKAAQLDPNHIETRWALVELYLELPGLFGGSVSTSKEYANQILKISSIHGYCAKAHIAEYEDDEEKAKEYYTKALTTTGYENCYQHLKKMKNEHPDFPDNPRKWAGGFCEIHHRNYIHYQLGKAAAKFNIQPERGLFYMQLYIDDYTPVDGVPLNWAYMRMAQLYRHLGDKEKATFWIRKSLKFNNDFDLALQEKARVEAM